MPNVTRSFIGPAVLAIGVWCAAGAVALPSSDAIAARVVVLPPWWLLAAALGAAWLVPSCRREPGLATPALLSVLPWLPVPIPAIALIWTGRLAWVPVGLALVALFRRAKEGSAPETRPASDRTPRPTMVAASALAAVALLAAAWALSPRLPGGDEPHYLIITQSLLKDGDLQIENNHQARDYASYYTGTLNPDFLRRGRHEVIYSIHAPGLPVLVAPLFAVFGYAGAQATLVLCAVLTSALVWACGWTATQSKSAAWFAWAAVTASLTFLIEGVSIFPDGPAGTIVAACTLILLRFERRLVVTRAVLIAVSGAIAFLPFLHTRLAVLSVGVVGAIVWALATEPGRTAGERRRRVMSVLLLPTAGFLAWLAYFQVLYGTPNPAVAYGTHPETRAAYVPGGVLGLLLDQDFGLLAFAPVLGAAAVGWLRRDPAVATGRAMLAVALLYVAAVGTYWMWWAGLPATPARFAAAVLPVLAPGLAVAWSRSGRTGRTVLTMLLGMTMAITAVVLTVGRGGLAWNSYDAHVPWLSWLQTSTDLARGVPSFFWDLDPGTVMSERPFALHVVVLCAVIAALGFGARTLARRTRAPEVVAAWAVAVGVMACVQAGWVVTSAAPLQPIGAQLRVLDLMDGGRPVRLVTPARPLGRPAHADDLEMQLARAGLANARELEWATVPRLPAGDYSVTIVERRPVGGTLTVQGEGRALQTFTLGRVTEQTLLLRLPAGARELSFAPDAVLAGAAERVGLRKR